MTLADWERQERKERLVKELEEFELLHSNDTKEEEEYRVDYYCIKLKLNKIIEEIIFEMEQRVNNINRGYNTSSRRYNFDIAVTLYEKNEELRDIWDYIPDAKLIKDRFIKHINNNIVEDIIEVVTNPIFNHTENSNENNKHFERDDIGSDGGTYLVANTLFNPFTHEEFYLIKVGLGKNLHDRLHTYNTYNPMLWTIDYKLIKNEGIRNRYEKLSHILLKEISIEKTDKANEWFRVDRETYLTICSQGFAFFGDTCDDIIKKLKTM